MNFVTVFHELGICERTVVNSHNYSREVCDSFFFKNNIIGGPGDIADIDKSKFDKVNFIKVGVFMECGRLMG